MRIRAAKCRAENSTGGHHTWRRVILIWEWGQTPESALSQLCTSYTSAHSLLVNMTQTDCNRAVLKSLRPKASSWRLAGEIFQPRIQKMENSWLFLTERSMRQKIFCHLIVWCKLLLTGNHFYHSICKPCIWLTYSRAFLRQKKKGLEIQKLHAFPQYNAAFRDIFFFCPFPTSFSHSRHGREIIGYMKLYSNSFCFIFVILEDKEKLWSNKRRQNVKIGSS